jgi:hypothetical protein
MPFITKLRECQDVWSRRETDRNGVWLSMDRVLDYWRGFVDELPLRSNLESANHLVERGRTTYRQRLASILEPSHNCQFVAVEPDSGRYFLGSTATAALVTAHGAMPNNLFYLTRVGRETAHTVGGQSTRAR